MGEHKSAVEACNVVLRVRLHIIRNERIEIVGKSQSCVISKLRITCKQIVDPASGGGSGCRRQFEATDEERAKALFRRAASRFAMAEDLQSGAVFDQRNSHSHQHATARGTNGAFPYNP